MDCKIAAEIKHLNAVARVRHTHDTHDTRAAGRAGPGPDAHLINNGFISHKITFAQTHSIRHTLLNRTRSVPSRRLCCVWSPVPEKQRTVALIPGMLFISWTKIRAAQLKPIWRKRLCRKTDKTHGGGMRNAREQINNTHYACSLPQRWRIILRA